jgi:phosphoribosylformimino-5-aminoimidazole carboxamide ribotide isomerase
LTDDTRPEKVAAAYAQSLQLQQVYLADLDAIAGAEPDWDTYRQIGQHDLRLWIDAGVAHRKRAAAFGVWTGTRLPVELIVGLESLASAGVLREILSDLGPQRVVVSLDLMRGRTWTRVQDWQVRSPTEVARHLLELGVRRLILLDVTRVGTGTGTGTVELLRQIRSIDTDVQLICGGGLSSLEQIEELAGEGCSGVLLGSALHTGCLGMKELRWVQRL